MSVWDLQLPTGTPGSPTTISSTQLRAGYSSQYFMTDPNTGALDFDDPGVNCVTTPNSAHCRSELSEVTASGAGAVWSPSGTNTLSATLVVTVAGGSPVIGQIHLDPAKSVRPLIELYYSSNGAISAGVEQTTAGGNEVKTSIGSVSPGTKFSYVISYTHNVLSVSLNGGSPKTLSVYSLGGIGGYFKAGDYGQSASDAKVQFYGIKIFHGP